jgi:K+:H+ antiporter subunit KhtT
MAEVTETKLPGIGVRYEFVTSGRTRVGVLVHRAGRREVLVYSERDPSECEFRVTLDSDDSHTLAELLGASRIAEQLATVQQEIEGLAIDWIRVHPDAPWAGRSLADAAIHTATGVSVVAIIGPSATVAAPGADDVLAPGATVIAIGEADGLAEVATKLQGP